MDKSNKLLAKLAKRKRAKAQINKEEMKRKTLQ